MILEAWVNGDRKYAAVNLVEAGAAERIRVLMFIENIVSQCSELYDYLMQYDIG